MNEYIEAYGGDRTKVTIAGMSAGGASIHYHMLSPRSRNLFRNAISLSGSALNWWANVKHPKKKAERLFKHFNCQNGDSAKGKKEPRSAKRRCPVLQVIYSILFIALSHHLLPACQRC